MPSIILKKYSEPEFLPTTTDDSSPLTYENWVKKNFGISSDDSDSQYQRYLLNWYSDKKTSTGNSLKEDYIALLKRISFVFRDDSEFRQFTNIDFDDDVQLKIAIPYYVKKLKEIAIYYRNKREAIKRAKLKYNMIGSFNAVERTFYDYILKAFSKRDYVLNVPTQSAWNAFPDLSSVNTGFSIEIQELYDDTDLFNEHEESSYSHSLSSSNPLLYIFDEILENAYNVSSIDDVPLSGLDIPISNNCLFSKKLKLDSLQISNEKYIGTDKFWLTGGYYEDDFYDVELPFSEGNNFFYWFSGEYVKEAPHPHFLPIPINNLDWIKNGATSSPIYSSSDIIFTKSNNTVEGAWLADYSNILVEDTMSVNLRDKKLFKYPYPGIGVSAEGLEWTGKTVNEIEVFNKTFFPNQTIKNRTEEILNDLYWTDSDSISSVRPIRIHETTLIEDGAYASKKFHKADKIYSRTDTSDSVHDDVPNEVFTNSIDISWLYDFKRTQLPIKRGTTNIYWPLQTYEEDEEIYIDYPYGDDVYINDIDMGAFTGSVAGTNIESSDVIYKLDSKCGSPIEAAWLKGAPLSSFNTCKTRTLTSLEETTVIESIQVTTTEWTPARIPNVLNWWASSDILPKTASFDFGWLDKIRNSDFTLANVKLAPTYNKNRESLILTGDESLNWSTVRVETPFTVAFVFNVDDNGKYGLVAGDSSNVFNIEVNDGTLSLKCRNKTITSTKVISPNNWYYVIATINESESKLIVSGTENFGDLNDPNGVTFIRYGSDSALGNKLKGQLKDLIFIKYELSTSVESELKNYLTLIATNNSNSRPILTSEDVDRELQLYNIISQQETSDKADIGEFVDGAIQAGHSFRADANETSRFIWTGEGEQSFKRSLNDPDYKGFHGFEHDKTCPYLQIKNRRPLNNDSTLNEQWKLCECGAIDYSPLGHTGNTYKAHPLGDYIILDTGFPNFNSLEDWKGTDGRPWNTSKDFGWFKLDDGQIDGEVGWGTGKWLTNSGDEFEIVPGKIYNYHRTGINTNCKVSLNNTVSFGPFFIGKNEICECRYLDCDCVLQSCIPKWYKAKLVNGEWIETNEVSNLRLESGSFYTYDHKEKIPFSVAGEDNTIADDCVDSTNFILAVNIENALPYWAEGTYDYGKTTQFKGLMSQGELSDVLHEYLYINQPPPSDLLLTDDSYFEYERSSECTSACFIWNQPLIWDIDFNKQVWNKIEIDECVKSDILHFIQNSDCKKCVKLKKKCPDCCNSEKLCGCLIDDCITTKTGLTATNEESEMLLRTACDFEPVFVNYYAQNDFNMSVRVVDTTFGLPPSGGRWVPEDTISYSTARSPWSNLGSLYEPFIANNINTSLYTREDSGYFIPEQVGFTNIILNDKIIGLYDVANRDATSKNIVLDTAHYARGPYSVTYTDSSWMKWNAYCIGGEIKNASIFQEFVPYQTSFESLKRNEYGIERQTDLQTPWTGIDKSKFGDDDRFPSNIKGEIPVECGPNSWFNNQPVISGALDTWKVDIYGNQYGIYKDDYCNIFATRYSFGNLWVRDLIGNTADSNQLLSRVLDTYKYDDVIVDALTSNKLYDFDVIYDTLILQLEDHIIFEKLNMDYSDGIIYSIADQSCVFTANSSEYSGTWLNETDKLLTFSYLNSGSPIIQQLDIDTSKFYKLYESSGEWDVNLDSNDPPSFCYNQDRNIFTLSYAGLSGADEVIVISNFEYDDVYSLKLKDLKVIPMDLNNKKIIKTSSYKDSLLFVFEAQTCPNQIYQIVIDN